MKQTAVARYLHVSPTPNHRPNKRLRKAAWGEVRDMLAQAATLDRHTIASVRSRAASDALRFSDQMYGADKYGRDVSQPLVLPTYFGDLPPQPEHGFRVVYGTGRDSSTSMYLWHDERWVKLSGALLRDVGSSGLRVALALACQYQEMRRWASDRHRLKFRDQVIDVHSRYEATKHR